MSDTPILFFSPGACSFGSIVALEWIGQPYKLCKVDREERQSEAYKKINEMAQVPALLTAGGEVLTENSAILQHIGALDLSKEITFKQGTANYDKLNMMLSYYGSNFHVAFYPYFAPQRYHDDEKVQAELKENAIRNIRTKYEYINQCFEGGYKYHFDIKPNIVDAYAYGMLRWGAKEFDIAQEFPNIQTFMKAQEEDPAFKFALAAEKGGEAESSGGFKGFVKLDEVEAPKSKAA